jgi:hypothetical protein
MRSTIGAVCRHKSVLCEYSWSANGPGLRTCALQQVGSYLGYTGYQIDVVVMAARDPKRKCRTPGIPKASCNPERAFQV